MLCEMVVTTATVIKGLWVKPAIVCMIYVWRNTDQQCDTHCVRLMPSPAHKKQSLYLIKKKTSTPFSQAAITHLWVSVPGEGVPASGRLALPLDQTI